MFDPIPLPNLAMKPIVISPISLVLGALIAVGLFLVMGQAAPSTPIGSWGPPKKGIVNIFEEPATPLQILAGALTSVYQVPDDRWLTVTAAQASSSSLYELRWAELYNGVLATKGVATIVTPNYDPQDVSTSPTDAGGAVGWVFRPGSQVVIRNAAASGSVSVYRFVLLGYETRD